MFSFADQIGDYPVLLAKLEIFYSEPTSSARRSPHPMSSARIARSRLPRRLSDGGSSSKVLDCSTVNQLPIRTPRRFAPLTRRIPAASSGLGQVVKKGQPLFTLYSPDLVATQEEYLISSRARSLLVGRFTT